MPQVEFIQNKQDEWKTIPLNIAVIGSSGVGKSSFINAIRNLTADDPEAAEVGCTDTIFEIKSYSHPNNKMLKLWDLPGVGTFNCSKETYLEILQVERYDFFVLLSATRFTEIDEWLRSEIVKRLGKQFFYVRTKIDNDVSNHKKSHPQSFNAETQLTILREKTLKNLKDIGSTCTKVFFIDSYEQQEYDFQKLKASMINDFPENKRHALVVSLSKFCETMIKTKADELRKRIRRTAALSAGVALIPIPGASFAIDVAMTSIMAAYYHQQLGLDDNSLARHAQETSVDLPQLQRVVKEALEEEFFKMQGFKKFISTVAIAGPLTDEFLSFVPFVGSFVAGALSFGGTYLAHKVIINKLEIVALQVFTLTAVLYAKKIPKHK